MPMASMTSALRRLLLAKLPDARAAWLASVSGLRVLTSVSQARLTSSEPIRVTMPSSGWIRAMTSR